MYSAKQPSPLTLNDLTTLFEFEDSQSGECFCLSLMTVLQCLCIAEQCHIVPPLDKEWEALTIPAALRERGRIADRVNS